ncbi:CYFA0S13e01882g1_1 [Cyberlindnera fabianii]|uniref:CYFA0S13e01882g1_1 n=1 Tax=Cyberlindnera fabianii TaxID=36022 RepID=A0A061B2A8_CYBFA|nr:CYFA0S13e01882g1_1 [Cyberlindnera fabianii]
MLIPTKSSNLDLCPSKLLMPRAFTSDVVSTAKSFKSWDTCMDNTACKIIAIVGIVLAAIVIIWILGGILRCLCWGVSGICQALCCCCLCCRGDDNRRREFNDAPSGNNPFDNPNMYPQRQQGMQQVYYPPTSQPHYGHGYVSDEVRGEKIPDPYRAARREAGNY